MNINLDEIAGFDAAAEEIRYVYEERDVLRDEVSYLRKFREDICRELGAPAGLRGEAAIEKARGMKEFNDDIIHDVSNLCKQLCEAIDIDPECGENGAEKLIAEAKRLRESVNKQEDFTEEAADILGVHPGDLTLSDVLEALRKLKREEKLDDMNSSIIADLRTELDQSQRAFSGEHSRRLAAEKYISDTFQRAAKELGMTSIPDGIDALCDEIADLRNYRNRISCPKEFWEAICDIMEMDACDAVPSDVVGMTKETKQRLISILALNPDTATWTDIYDGIKAEQKDHCNLISESFKMKHELEKLKNKSENYRQSHVFRSVCVHLSIGWESATLSDVIAVIDGLKKLENGVKNGVKNGDLAMAKQLEQDKKFLKGELEHADERRRHWVRRYKEEHERAVNLDKLYREWKDKYETYYQKTSNMAEQNESLMASYMAVKNTAIKQKDILKVVCRYLAGKDNLPDKDIVVRLNEMWTKENGWDGLVKHYGKKAIGELIDACDDEITETTRKDLEDMLSK